MCPAIGHLPQRQPPQRGVVSVASSSPRTNLSTSSDLSLTRWTPFVTLGGSWSCTAGHRNGEVLMNWECASRWTLYVSTLTLTSWITFARFESGLVPFKRSGWVPCMQTPNSPFIILTCLHIQLPLTWGATRNSHNRAEHQHNWIFFEATQDHIQGITSWRLHIPIYWPPRYSFHSVSCDCYLCSRVCAYGELVLLSMVGLFNISYSIRSEVKGNLSQFLSLYSFRWVM